MAESTAARSAPALGADYDGTWARRPLPALFRRTVSAAAMEGVVRALAPTQVRGVDRLTDLAAARRPDGLAEPVIFAANHHSHLDTALLMRTVPSPWRQRLATVAAADYFFDTLWKARLASLVVNALPVDREAVGRRSAQQMTEVINDGWSLVIYPEGGRSPDGWGQPFKGGTAYLSARTGAPIVPVHILGTDAVYAKGMRLPQRGRTLVTFGRPLRQLDGESTRRYNRRIEQAVAALADETTTDYWSALRRAARGETPPLTGPELTGWRRRWSRGSRTSPQQGR